jgi:hypothetical protein
VPTSRRSKTCKSAYASDCRHRDRSSLGTSSWRGRATGSSRYLSAFRVNEWQGGRTPAAVGTIQTSAPPTMQPSPPCRRWGIGGAPQRAESRRVDTVQKCGTFAPWTRGTSLLTTYMCGSTGAETGNRQIIDSTRITDALIARSRLNRDTQRPATQVCVQQQLTAQPPVRGQPVTAASSHQQDTKCPIGDPLAGLCQARVATHTRWSAQEAGSFDKSSKAPITAAMRDEPDPGSGSSHRLRAERWLPA